MLGLLRWLWDWGTDWAYAEGLCVHDFALSADTVSGLSISADTATGFALSGDTVSGLSLSADTVSGFGISGPTVTGLALEDC